MAYVSVPKDLQKIKSKVVLNLTARQVFCFAIAAVTGLPFYFFTKDLIGTGNAGAGMVLLMLPAFLFAMYEKDGLPLERVLLNMINVRLRRPAVRRYEVHNLYDMAGMQSRRKTRRVRMKHGENGFLPAGTGLTRM